MALLMKIFGFTSILFALPRIPATIEYGKYHCSLLWYIISIITAEVLLAVQKPLPPCSTIVYAHRPKEAEENTVGRGEQSYPELVSIYIDQVYLDNVHVCSGLPFHWSLICSISANPHTVLIDV